MNKNNEIIIKFSKVKICFFILVCLALITFSYLLLLEKHLFINIIGLLSILILVLGIVSLSKVLFSYSPAIIINEKGIIDNYSYLKVGLILWDEIKDIKVITVDTRYSKIKCISIFVKNPNKYLNKGNFFKRFFSNLNTNNYGTPIHITSSFLSADFESLNTDILKFYKKSIN